MSDIDHFDVKITYKRKEHSKDSNGSDRIFTLINKQLFYDERFWGFKSEKRKVTRWNLELSEEMRRKLFSFISDNQLDTDYEEYIQIDKPYLRNEYSCIIEVNTILTPTVYQIQTNDWDSDNASWRKSKKLFDFLQNLSDI